MDERVGGRWMVEGGWKGWMDVSHVIILNLEMVSNIFSSIAASFKNDKFHFSIEC